MRAIACGNAANSGLVPVRRVIDAVLTAHCGPALPFPDGSQPAALSGVRVEGHPRAAELEGIRAGGRAWAIQMV
jgi:hypothetical protein